MLSQGENDNRTKRDDAARFLGDIPRHYDRGLGPIIFADYADITARRAAEPRPARVLEIAAGTGILTRALRDPLGAEASLTATDLNGPMLDVARAKFRAGEKVAFATADALDLPFPDASFDLAACQFGVMFFPDKEKSYRQARRALARGGQYLFSVWDAAAHNPFSAVVSECLAASFGADPPPFLGVPFGYFAIDPIKAALQAAGFGNLRVDVIGLEKSVPDCARFAEGLVLGSPISDQLRARGGDPAAFAAEVATALSDRVVRDGRMPLQAILFEAEAC
ncbi:MAG: methyltransferase domain-containing protein [Roseiarcus sp.]